MLTTITVEPTSASVFETRRAIADVLAAASVPVPQAERVVLALSELVTNAVRHGPPVEIRIDVDVDGDEIELRVKQRSGHGTIPNPDSWRLPEDRGQITGRGLAIVAAVSDATEVVEAGAVVEVRARFGPRAPRTPIDAT